jgi:hypothetical protein
MPNPTNVWDQANGRNQIQPKVERVEIALLSHSREQKLQQKSEQRENRQAVEHIILRFRKGQHSNIVTK